MVSLFKTKQVFIPSPKPHGLSVTRDQHGIPHVSAENINDLNWGLGFCQAIDRGTQLQLMRIIGQGRLCERLENSEDNLKIDTFFRRLNWHRSAEKQLSSLTPATLQWCQALCDGINAGLRNKRISVLKFLGVKAEPWTLADTLLIFRMSSYLTLAQSQAEIERLFVELTQAGVSTEKLASLFPISVDTFDRELIEKINLTERIIPSDLLWEGAIPRMMASNNWVTSPSKNQSGHAMLANDPHLEVNRLPNVFYEIVLSSPEYQTMGFTMPGLPGILIGRTPDMSWGATYTFMDTVDSWVEECKNGKFRRGKSWKAFQTRDEVILRKNDKPHTITFYENAHGTLEGDPHKAGFYLSTAWSPADYGAASLNANYALTQAKNAEQAMPLFREIESAWNWVIADSEGNIAYQMSGLCPKRHPDWNGFTPAPGWDKAYDWQGFIDKELLPCDYNPECGFIVTANQDLNHLGKVPVINMPMGDYRAKRIEQRLATQQALDIDQHAALQMDTYSLQAELFLKILVPLVEQEANEDHLDKCLLNWNLHYDKHSVGANLFEAFYSELRKRVFADQQLNTKVIEHLTHDTGLFIDFYQNFDACLLDPDSLWYQEANQEQHFIAAFEQAKTKFDGKSWGDVNRFDFKNILLQGKLPDWSGFDVKQQSLIGGRATPHQGQVFSAGGRDTSFAAAFRMVADLGEHTLHTRLAGGPSDQRFSPWYKSEINEWLAGSLKKVSP